MNEQWQTAELQKYLASSHDELVNNKSVYLSNPEHNRAIDTIIIQKIWPAIKKSVSKSPISVYLGNSGHNIHDSIDEEWSRHATKSITFILNDPERPIGTAATTWLCRGEFRCSADNYLITFNFFIYFPMEFDIKKILFLLKHPDFIGMPPDLSYEHDAEELSLHFTKGRGAGGGGLFTYTDMAVEHMQDAIHKNLDVIYALNDLEVDLNRSQSFDSLCKVLVKAYGSR